VVIRLAQHLLQTRRPIFENVFLVLPTDQNEAEVRLLYPSDNPLEGRSLDDLRDHWYLNLDPAKWKVLSEHPSGAGDPPTSPSSA